MISKSKVHKKDIILKHKLFFYSLQIKLCFLFKQLAYVGFGSSTQKGPGCYEGGFVKATDKNKQLLLNYLKNLNATGILVKLNRV